MMNGQLWRRHRLFKDGEVRLLNWSGCHGEDGREKEAAQMWN